MNYCVLVNSLLELKAYFFPFCPKAVATADHLDDSAAAMRYLRVSVSSTVRPSFTEKVDMGSLTCATERS